jgi:hypothetical protein
VTDTLTITITRQTTKEEPVKEWRQVRTEPGRRTENAADGEIYGYVTTVKPVFRTEQVFQLVMPDDSGLLERLAMKIVENLQTQPQRFIFSPPGYISREEREPDGRP